MTTKHTKGQSIHGTTVWRPQHKRIRHRHRKVSRLQAGHSWLHQEVNTRQQGQQQRGRCTLYRGRPQHKHQHNDNTNRQQQRQTTPTTTTQTTTTTTTAHEQRQQQAQQPTTTPSYRMPHQAQLENTEGLNLVNFTLPPALPLGGRPGGVDKGAPPGDPQGREANSPN